MICICVFFFCGKQIPTVRDSLPLTLSTSCLATQSSYWEIQYFALSFISVTVTDEYFQQLAKPVASNNSIPSQLIKPNKQYSVSLSQSHRLSSSSSSKNIKTDSAASKILTRKPSRLSSTSVGFCLNVISY
jgi:hypothetical protein